VETHDGAVTVGLEIPHTNFGLTGGEDGRVVLWDLSNPEKPVPQMTVLRMEAPVTDIMPPGEDQSMVAQDNEGRIAVLHLDPGKARAAKVVWYSIGQRVPLARDSDGTPIIPIRAGRLRVEVISKVRGIAVSWRSPFLLRV